MEFLSTAKAVPMPHLGALGILDETNPCMVPAVHAEKTKTEALSALQLSRGIKKGEATFVAALVGEDQGREREESLPPVIQEVKEELKDVMPPELPKKLPPRREVDHRIELEPVPPAPSSLKSECLLLRRANRLKLQTHNLVSDLF